MKLKYDLILITRVKTINQRVRVSKILHSFERHGAKSFKKFLIAKVKDSSDINHRFDHVDIVGISKPSKKKMVDYLTWMRSLFVFFLKNRSRTTIYYTLGFESAVILYMLSLIFRVRYIYDNADSFYLSHRLRPAIKTLAKKIEEKVANRSLAHLLPDEYRAAGFKSQNNIRLLKNFPSKRAFQAAQILSKSLSKDAGTYIYINGWLPETRGLDMIEKALYCIPSEADILFIVAGKSDSTLSKILEHPKVRYLGTLTNEESLSYSIISDYVLTFYDPTIEINRIASPNKWGDAIVTDTIPVLNSEIVTKDYYFKEGGYIDVPYDDYKALVQVFVKIANRKIDTTILKKQLSNNETYFWDVKFEGFLEDTLK